MCYCAGLYDCWKDAAGHEVYTYTIMTTDSSPRIQWLHNRMPVLLRTAKERATWLSAPFEQAAALLRPYNEEDLVWYPVTQAMNKAGYSGSDCAVPMTRPTRTSFFGSCKVKATERLPCVTAVVHDDAVTGHTTLTGKEREAPKSPSYVLYLFGGLLNFRAM